MKATLQTVLSTIEQIMRVQHEHSRHFDAIDAVLSRLESQVDGLRHDLAANSARR